MARRSAGWRTPGTRIPINREPDPVRGEPAEGAAGREPCPARAQVLPDAEAATAREAVSSCGSRTSRRARMLTGTGVTDSLSLRRPRRPGGMRRLPITSDAAGPSVVRETGGGRGWTHPPGTPAGHVGQTPRAGAAAAPSTPSSPTRPTPSAPPSRTPPPTPTCPDCGGSGIEWPKMRHACDRCGGLGVIPVADLTDDERDRLLRSPRVPRLGQPPRPLGARAMRELPVPDRAPRGPHPDPPSRHRRHPCTQGWNLPADDDAFGPFCDEPVGLLRQTPDGPPHRAAGSTARVTAAYPGPRVRGDGRPDSADTLERRADDVRRPHREGRWGAHHRRRPRDLIAGLKPPRRPERRRAQAFPWSLATAQGRRPRHRGSRPRLTAAIKHLRTSA